ncbi:putative ABC transport system permease protein, partial [Evansella caseinilytica]
MNIKLFPKRKSRQLIVVLVVILLLLPFSFLSLGEASQTVKQEIHDFARGSYDILLRPWDSRSEIEQQLGLVEDNYLGIGAGGITRSQWENVLAREDVEIAAPVAAIGLFKPPQITYALPPRPDEALRYNVTHFTFDGVNTYALENFINYSVPDKLYSQGCIDIGPLELINTFRCENPMYYFPDAYHQVVAIDVDQEALLTGNNFSIIREAYTPFYWEGDNFLEIPIISLQDSQTPLKAAINIEAIDFKQEENDRLKEKYGIDANDSQLGFFSLHIWGDSQLHNELMEEMNDKPALSSEKYELDFSEKVTPFYDSYLYADNDYQFFTYEEQMISDISGQISSFSQKQFYFLHPVEYDLEENNVSIRQVDVDEASGVPIYRKMDNVQSYVFDDGEITDGFGFSFKHAGYF